MPCTLGAVVAFLLGTLGYVVAGFGMNSARTDFNEAPHACDALSRWLEAGIIGQGVLIVVSIGLLITGLGRPQSRLLVSIAAWITAAMTIAWYYFCIIGGYHSYSH